MTFEEWLETRPYVDIDDFLRDAWESGYQVGMDDVPTAEYEPPEGYVLVPVEPTEKMVEAGYNAYVNSGWIRTYEIYEAMIQAAQERA